MVLRAAIMAIFRSLIVASRCSLVDDGAEGRIGLLPMVTADAPVPLLPSIPLPDTPDLHPFVACLPNPSAASGRWWPSLDLASEEAPSDFEIRPRALLLVLGGVERRAGGVARWCTMVPAGKDD